jgi:hypothetical protein
MKDVIVNAEKTCRAVNSAGPSDPSNPSDMVIIEEQPGRPCIDLSGVKDITVRAGEPYTIKIPYTGGNPKPSADFVNGSSNIFEDDRIKIEVRLVTDTLDLSEPVFFR